MLHSMGLQRVGRDWVTEQQQQPWVSHNRRSTQGTWHFHWKSTGRIWQGPIILFYDAPDSFKIESILAERGTWHQEGAWVRPNMAKQDNWPETTWKLTRFTIKAEAARHVAEHPSCIPLHYCSQPGGPLPYKGFFLFQHMCFLRQFISKC